MVANLVYHSKTKHIDVKYHFVRQAIGEGGVDLKKVHTQENCACMFAKSVLLEKLQWCVTSLGLKKRWWIVLVKVLEIFVVKVKIVNNDN